MVLRMSLPAMTAWERLGEMSRAAMEMPVLWVTVWEAPGLD